jgi:multisubunit Na+/H+ antiporter MnhC subunit
LKRPILFLLVVIGTIGVAAPASASTMVSPTFSYIDPATGTLILSAIIGGFAAIGMFIKKFWYRIKALFTGGRSEPVLAETDQDGVTRGTDNPIAPE